MSKQNSHINPLILISGCIVVFVGLIMLIINATTYEKSEEDYYREQVMMIDDAAYEYCCNILGDSASNQVIWGFYNINRATCDSVALANMDNP